MIPIFFSSSLNSVLNGFTDGVIFTGVVSLYTGGVGIASGLLDGVSDTEGLGE